MRNLIKSITNTVKYWYVPLILGIIFILCGIWAISSPLSTFLALSVLFSLSFIISGIGDLIFAAANAKELKGWGWYLVSGFLSLILGILLVAYPAISMTALTFIVGFTLLFRSFQLFGFSLELKDNGMKNWGYVTLASVLGVITSFILLANPIFTGISIVVFTALAFIFIGIAYIVLSINLKKVKKSAKNISSRLREKIEALQKEIEDEWDD